MSEYEKARVYYDWICSHCAYDYGADDTSISHLPYAVFKNAKAVCDGYTGAYNLLLKLEGIDCTALGNETHIWTVATLDGESYHIDTTWGDAAGGATNYQYFGMDEMTAWLEDFGGKIRPYLCDTGAFLRQAQAGGKKLLFEAQLGALRDLDYGIYPYTTSSNAIAAYAPVGSGLPSARIDEIVGVVKAYSTCVGEGPFTCEWLGDEAEELRRAGGEYGAKTGRPRRVGPIDLVATRYGVEVQGATNIALTKLDILSYMSRRTSGFCSPGKSPTSCSATSTPTSRPAPRPSSRSPRNGWMSCISTTCSGPTAAFPLTLWRPGFPSAIWTLSATS